MGPKLATISLVLLTLFTNSLQSPYSSTTTECPPYHNGSIAGNSCSREYFVCVDGIRQDAICNEGYVFFEDGCIEAEESPECQIAEDTEEEPYDQFDCLSKPDGLYSIGCVNQFVNCVAEQAYQMFCPDNLVFNQKTEECRESCDDTEEDTTTAAPTVYSTEEEDDNGGYDEGSGETDGYDEPQPTTEQPETVDFDCNGLENGNYPEGCSDVFYTCNENVAFKRYCPSGTVYNPSQQACDYDCTESVTTTTQSYVPTTEADVTSTTTTTVVYPEYTTTGNDQPEYTTTPQDDSWSTTTAGYSSTTPGFDDTTTTTRAPVICQEGQVTSFGMCSSRFNRCQSNTVRSKQCPVNTLFESSLVLCVFDLPECQPVTVPSTVYNNNGYISYGPPSDTIVSPFDENVRLKPKFDRRPKYHHGPARRPAYGSSPNYGNTLLENPFFIPRHYPRPHHGGDRHRGHSRIRYGPVLDSPFSTNFRGRAALNDQFKDYRRAKMGKIEYGEARNVVGNKRFLMDDEFDGPEARFVQSNIQQVFPEARHSKRRLGPRENPDGYKDDKTFDAKDLFGATRRKRSVYYGSQQSGYGQQYTQITARQAQVNKDCQQYTTPTFLTFGDCFDQFIYCSGNGINRMAACPIGETFNKALRACSESCGVSTPTVTATVGTQTADDSSNDDVTSTTSAPSSYNSYTTQIPSADTTTQSPWNDEPTTTSAPVGDRCSAIPSGLFSLGCSRKYIQCSNGAAIVRVCSESLFFNQAKQSCDHRDQVPECNAGPQDDVTTDSGLTQPLPYVTLEEVLSTTTTGYDNEPTNDYASSSAPSSYNSYSTQGPSSDGTYTTKQAPGNDQPTTTSAPIGDRCTSVPSGLFSLGCSQKYIQCSDGAAMVRTCSGPLFFDEAAQACNHRDEVPECGEAATPYAAPVPYSPSSTTTSGYDNESTEPAEDYTTSAPYSSETPASESPEVYTTVAEDETTVAVVTDSYNRVADESEEEEDFNDEEKCTVGTRSSKGFCVQSYSECTPTGYVEKTCKYGKLFDGHESRCVARIACGKQALREAIHDIMGTTTVSPKKLDARCAHVEGESVFALGSCSSSYVACSYGAAKLQHCSVSQVFSDTLKQCVSRESSSSGCNVIVQNPPVKSYYNNNDQSAYCDGKSDGLYGNKRDCSAILQCFGGELFEHPSCPSNLAFNELTGKCDYPQKVSGCENHGRTDGVCKEHGSFIADVDNCSVFYRCVWGRKVVMKCPSGTVFNPSLSVCDWPSAVPSCGPSTDNGSSYGGSTSNDDNTGY